MLSCGFLLGCGDEGFLFGEWVEGLVWCSYVSEWRLCFEGDLVAWVVDEGGEEGVEGSGVGFGEYWIGDWVWTCGGIWGVEYCCGFEGKQSCFALMSIELGTFCSFGVVFGVSSLVMVSRENRTASHEYRCKRHQHPNSILNSTFPSL